MPGSLLGRFAAGAAGTAPRAALLDRIGQFRSADGGYRASPGAAQSTAYDSFLAIGAYQDLQAELPEPERILDCLRSLRTADGGYTNQADLPVGLTPPTAAAATLLRHFGQPADDALGDWLLERCHATGGFLAGPGVPLPDLLSTATALHALAGLHVDFGHVQEACLDFVDSLWTSRGGFYGHWADDVLDCEYTYYGLLSLGHLSF